MTKSAQTNKKHSSLGDLQPIAQEIEAVIKKHLRLKERPAVAIAFTCEPTFDEVHYVTNVSPGQAAMIWRETADKIIAKNN